MVEPPRSQPAQCTVNEDILRVWTRQGNRAFLLVRFIIHFHPQESNAVSRYAKGQYEQDEASADAAQPTCDEPGMHNCTAARPPLDMPLSRRSWIDAAYTNETGWPKIRNGVKMGEGDGTVSLLSLGAMCVEGWKRKRWNPGGIKITTVEVRPFSFSRARDSSELSPLARASTRVDDSTRRCKYE